MIHSVREGPFSEDYFLAPGHEISEIDVWWVEWSGTEPTLAEVEAFIYPSKPRPMFDIVTELNALTGPQKNMIWSDFNSGSPKKWVLSTGPNSAAIASQASTIQLLQPINAQLNANDVLNSKIWIVAMYMLDNPNYLVNPPFDPTINIPGWA